MHQTSSYFQAMFQPHKIFRHTVLGTQYRQMHTLGDLVPRPCRRRKKWPGYETNTVGALLVAIVNTRHTHSSPIFLLACRRGTAAVAPPPCLGEAFLLPFVWPFVCLLQARGSGLPFHFQWRSWEEEEEKRKEGTVFGVYVARQCSEGQGGCYGDKHNLTWDTSLSQVQDLCGSFCTQLSSPLLNLELANQVSLNDNTHCLNQS